MEGRLVAVRARGRDRLYLPGGKREPGESDWTALSREVAEELGTALDPATFRELGVVECAAHDHPPGTLVRMACFAAEPTAPLHPASEIDELVLVTPADRPLLAPATALALDLAHAHGLLRP